MWIAGREVALRVEGERIVEVTSRGDPAAPHLVPAFIDAHVHLSVAGPIAGVAAAELRGGVAAVLDLGERERSLPFSTGPLRARWSGPLLTAPGGYPTQSWGRDGHGLELSTADEARAAVARLFAKGARFAKLAFDPRYPVLSAPVARAAADEAHRLGMLVAAHALDPGSVRRALEAGADVLAHAPVGPMPRDLLDRARGLWVISTLRAFGGSVRELREAGARVVYGTDLGNEGTAPGIDARELELLRRDGVDFIRAATLEAAELLQWPDLGRLAVGSPASLVAVRSLEPEAFGAPEWVMNCGRLVA